MTYNNIVNKFKHILILSALVLAALPAIVSCSDNDDDKVNDYRDWQSRNEAYFKTTSATAKKAIQSAKQAYGANWEQHCEWRTFLSYSLNPTASSNTPSDSIYVKIVKTGTGSGCPMGSDSIRAFYYGKLIPTDSHPNGYMFDHSGQSTMVSKIFDHNISVPSKFKVTDCVRGFATALQHMHIGDRWIIYVPNKMAYDTERTGIPLKSMLIFEVELVQYARPGTPFPVW